MLCHSYGGRVYFTCRCCRKELVVSEVALTPWVPNLRL